MPGKTTVHKAWRRPLAAVFVIGVLAAWWAPVWAETYLSVAENASVVPYPEAAVALRDEPLKAEDGQFPSPHTPVKEGVWVILPKDQQIRIGHRVSYRLAVGDAKIHVGLQPDSVRVWKLKRYSGTYLVGWQTYAQGRGQLIRIGTALVRPIGGKLEAVYKDEVIAHVSVGASGNRTGSRTVRLQGSVLAVEDLLQITDFLPVANDEADARPPLSEKRKVGADHGHGPGVELFVREVRQRFMRTIDLGVPTLTVHVTRYHLRSKADTLPELVAYYHVSEEALLGANGLDAGGLLRQEWVKIPQPR